MRKSQPNQPDNGKGKKGKGKGYNKFKFKRSGYFAVTDTPSRLVVDDDEGDDEDAAYVASVKPVKAVIDDDGSDDDTAYVGIQKFTIDDGEIDSSDEEPDLVAYAVHVLGGVDWEDDIDGDVMMDTWTTTVASRGTTAATTPTGARVGRANWVGRGVARGHALDGRGVAEVFMATRAAVTANVPCSPSSRPHSHPYHPARPPTERLA